MREQRLEVWKAKKFEKLEKLEKFEKLEKLEKYVRRLFETKTIYES